MFMLTIVYLYVNGVLLVSNSMKSIDDLKRKLKEEFKLTDQEESKSFLGIKIKRTEKTLRISQTRYL